MALMEIRITLGWPLRLGPKAGTVPTKGERWSQVTVSWRHYYCAFSAKRLPSINEAAG